MPAAEAPMRIERYRFAPLGADAITHEPNVAAPVIAAAATAEHETLSPVEEIPPSAPPPPTFSEQELELAREQAYQEGLGAGRAEALTDAEKAAQDMAASTKTLLDIISNRVTLAGESHLHYLRSQTEVMTRTVLAIARKIAGDALKREPLASVEGLLAECMGLIAGNEVISIVVAPEKADMLRQSLDTLKGQVQGFKGEIEITADASLGEHDCRLEWNNGQAERNIEELWNNVEALIRKSTLTQ